MFTTLKKTILALVFIIWALPASAQDKLNIEVYNPGTESLFPVTSTLITGKTEAILIDAQFQTNDARNLVQMIKDSGKKLKAVFISHGDPDFYFGLEVIKAAYPETKIYTSPETLKKINRSYESKIAIWGPKLGENAPSQIIIPEVLTIDTFTIDGQKVKIMGLDSHDPKRSYVWIPSTKTAIASISVFDNLHVWIADTQTPKSRQKWLETLNNIEILNPEKIIPGHYLGDSIFNMSSINFTRNYVNAFEDASANAKNSQELIDQMLKLYPEFSNTGTLVLSAKVIMGEMKWGS